MPLDYVLRRLAVFFIIIWAAATVNFILPKFTGMDPVRQKLLQEATRGGYVQQGMQQMEQIYRQKFGLDKPLWQQYLTYLNDLAHLDLNYSIAMYPRKTIEVIGDGIAWTISLLTMTTVLAFLLGSLAGGVMAWPRSPKWLGYLFAPFLTLSAVPYYLLGLTLMYFLGFQARWLPMFGGFSPGTIVQFSLPAILDIAAHTVLPALSLILSAIGFWALGMRSMMVTVQGEDYMILAEAKGLKDRTLLYRYAVRNAILPQITSLAIALGHVVSGAVLVEVVFAYPGIGNILYRSIRDSDFFVINGVIILIIVAIAVTTLLLDLSLPLLDPRITYKGAK